ncbi:chloride channel protein [Halioxenophilus sp. WMMB6]|uniref:chloride channel protein n=1 Tax=Halioxenophilus sp. WMMB6 TaxID=3073815 RepID=UPI00295EFC74|nr:chloride channel protein [Halioxenophilus sp. WMMB6]
MATPKRRTLRPRLHNLRRQLSYLDALPQLTILCLVAGVAAAVVIIIFRASIVLPLTAWLGHPEDFESLGVTGRFLVPLLGALLLGLLMQLLPSRLHKVGVTHVLDRLHNHQGHLPWQHFAVQFAGGVLSLVSGQSVGREGPAVHLGAGSASLVGQWLKIPNNSLRVMVAAGVAAAISAAFNTPLAGVVFAMEVVLLEYTIAGFIPIIIASFAGSLLSRLAFGADSVFYVQSVPLAHFTELPYMMLAGIAIGTVAIIYSRLLSLGNFVARWPIMLRISVAGLFTAAVATQVPEVLGMGYDTLATAMAGELGLQLLLVIIIAKLLTTGISLSFGIPGGLIGPTIFIGGVVGAALSYGGHWLYDEQASSVGFYVLLGMAAMFGAVLNAPLTALITILELTNNPNTIFPSMLVVVIACLCTRLGAGNKGIFQTLLRLQGRSFRSTGLTSELSRAGVFQVLTTNFVKARSAIDYSEAIQLLENKPLWIVLSDEVDKPKQLIKAADLAKFLEKAPEAVLTLAEAINLLEIPGQKSPLPPIHEQATLLEAYQLMKSESTDAIYVQNPRQLALESEVMGIVTREAVTNYYSL